LNSLLCPNRAANKQSALVSGLSTDGPNEPATTYATEGYAPNIPVAKEQLEPDVHSWSLAQEKTAVEKAGFRIRRSKKQLLDNIFYDIGAVIYYLKVIAWQIPNFSIEAYRDRLEAMHRLTERQGAFYATAGVDCLVCL
jgi:hypothetical protein